MHRIGAWVVILTVSWLSPVAQQTLPDLFKSDSGAVLKGRVVLYDWMDHETTSGDDFVVQTENPK